ncbi:DUF397 domain-containing protein [Streptomyces sp. CB01881]|uniref:DUF397 domain-containing protein n=1 Tax=Streptomyces sp. CB01881 TaxID=2078691 RepID=UPI000CDC1D20|nr:DUF397 domain-containing protein [Streptomyces sp. CB01881]AUY50262.1 DUF397 domain-containing protein [Streptomyces sp. CB01881]TYC73650.1 DUF397 domain-containing protein [Streptomyces sp. CB01881]
MAQLNWQKSSFSGDQANCVEVRNLDGQVELRESDCGDIIVRTTPTKFARLLQGVKAGEFDHHAAPLH